MLSYVATGLLFLVWVEGSDPETALYMIAQIVTTIGYGDAIPRSQSAEAFLTFYVLIGAMVFINVASDLMELLLRSTEAGLDKQITRILARLRGKPLKPLGHMMT